MNKNISKLLLALATVCTSTLPMVAADNAAAPASSSSVNPKDMALYVLVGVIALFVFIIVVLGSAVKAAGKIHLDKLREQNKSAGKMGAVILFLSMLGTNVYAQEANTPSGPLNPFQHWDLYLFVFIVLLLFIVVLVLVRSLYILMDIKKAEAKIMKAEGVKVRTWFQRFNETVPIEDEADLDMSHDYDGIRELDNKIPSWWTWAFFSFLVFGIIYLYRMFGSGTLPDQYTELKQANEIAAIEKMEYLKKGANNVDENNVTLLTGDAIAEGVSLYSKNCVACHGDKGQGGVGPNLTDDFWIHKGGIKDIFYSIKYGWQEKGMKSWKEDFSPSQIAQIASYVKSLHGTNPPGAKEKQGELYTDQAVAAPSDSTKAATTLDSLKK